MSARRLLQLFIALLVLGGLAALTRQCGSGRTKKAEGLMLGEHLFKDLDLNAIAAIEIAGPESTNLLSRSKGSWIVDSMYNYPLDFERLRESLTALRQLGVGQVIRGGEDLLGELGLSTNATRVTFRDNQAKTLAAFELGGSRQSQAAGGRGGYPDGQYLRMGDGPVVVVDASMSRWSARPEDWIEKELLRVPAADVTRVEVGEDESKLILTYPSVGSPAVSGLGPTETVQASNAGRLQRALSSLRATSVAPPTFTDEEAGLDGAVPTSIFTREGLVYTVRVGNPVDEGKYVRLSVSYEAPPAPTREQAEMQVPVETEPTAEDADSKPLTREEQIDRKFDELAAEHDAKVAATLKKLEHQRSLEDWIYVFASYSAESIALGRDDLVEQKEEETAEANKEAAPPSVTSPSPDLSASIETVVSNTVQTTKQAVQDAQAAAAQWTDETKQAAVDLARGAETSAKALAAEAEAAADSAKTQLMQATQDLQDAVTQSAEKASSAAQELAEDSSQAVKDAVQRARTAAEQNAESVREAVAGATDSVKAKVDELKAAADDLTAGTQDAADELLKQAKQVTQEAVAAGAAAAEGITARHPFDRVDPIQPPEGEKDTPIEERSTEAAPPSAEVKPAQLSPESPRLPEDAGAEGKPNDGFSSHDRHGPTADPDRDDAPAEPASSVPLRT